jgi:hypothetical protein
MTGEDAVQSLLEALNQLKIPHMLVGSYSTNYHGIPRSTKDADIVLMMKPGDVAQLMKLLPPGFDLDPQPSFEFVTNTLKTLLCIPAVPYEIELFALSDDAFDQARFASRVAIHFQGCPTFVPRAEDVIIQKLRWYGRGRRPKDLQDALDVLSVQRDHLDWARLRHWCSEHGTLEWLDGLLSDLGITT